MEFQSGTELSAMLVHYLHENVTAAVEVERTRYFFGSGGLDFDADGTFHHTCVSMSGGYILSCMWRTGCGDHLLSTFDIYGRAAVSYGFLKGDVDLAGDPPLDGTVGFSFNGPGLGGEVGLVYYITRVLGVAIELGHSWILFDSVTVNTGDEELTDRISGTSGRTHLGVSLQTRFPF